MGPTLVLLRFAALWAIFAIDPGHSSCSFPSGLTSGTWRSTRWDDLTFSSSQVTVPDLNDLGTNVVFNCDASYGTKYLVRSAGPVTILTNNVEIVACLDFSTGIDAVKTVYYHATNEVSLPSGAAQPVRLVTPGTAITEADTCTVTTYATGTHDLLIETDQISAAAITCPDPLLATFNNYSVITSTTFTSSNCGAGGGYITVCDDTKTVQVDYGVCPTVILYSSGGRLSCVHSSNSSVTTYYVNLLNLDNSVDNSDTYHYTCVVVDYTESPLYMSQVPRKCSSSQTATALPATGGATLELHANLTCVPTSGSDGFPVIPVVAAAAGLFFIVVCAIVFYYFCIHKGYLYKGKAKKKKQREKERREQEKKNKKSGKVAPSDAISADSLGMPMDAKSTGLQATAIVSPGLPGQAGEDVSADGRRHLETAQSTRSVVTPSHMQTDLMLDEQTPRRLPALEPITPAHGHLLLSTNEGSEDLNVSVSRKLPPINESSSLQS